MESIYWDTYGFQDTFYMVTLDNQSNANFKVFDMHKNDGFITYNPKYNELSSNVSKKLYISGDFNHFIVTTYDQNTKHAYIDYFDKSYNKLWSREFDNNSNDETNISPLDYNPTQMAIIIDTDLYLIDLNTGEDLIEPVIVGIKTQVNMMEDGIVLIGTENKDTIVKVGYDGKIKFRLDGDTDMSNIYGVISQVVNGKLVVFLTGSDSSGFRSLHKYIVVNKDGSIESQSNDLEGGW